MIAGLSSERLLFVQESPFEERGNYRKLTHYNHKGVNLWVMSLAKVSIS